MKELLPSWSKNNKQDGLLISINTRCQKCIYNTCKAVNERDTWHECPHGFNYIKSDEKIFFGILVLTKNYSKQKRESIYAYPDYVLSQTIFDNIILFNKNIIDEIKEATTKEKKRILDDYIKNKQYRKELLAEIKESAEKNFSFFHDYQQINGTISRNINVIILTKTNSTGDITDDILSKCTKNEVAIYHASQILEEKLNTAKAMRDITWLNRTNENTKFKVHGCILKYIRMYKSLSDQKNIQVNVSGSSHKEIVKNPKAFSIIPHTFIDNAIKYSPKSSNINVYINDEDGFIDFYVKSYGPKIKEDEFEKIFVPFYRGKCAIEAHEEGTGRGLYVAQKIAVEHLNSRITVRQGDSLNQYYETIFSIKIPLD